MRKVIFIGLIVALVLITIAGCGSNKNTAKADISDDLAAKSTRLVETMYTFYKDPGIYSTEELVEVKMNLFEELSQQEQLTEAEEEVGYMVMLMLMLYMEHQSRNPELYGSSLVFGVVGKNDPEEKYPLPSTEEIAAKSDKELAKAFEKLYKDFKKLVK